MSNQLPLPAMPWDGLPPVALKDDALRRFTLQMNRQLAEFDDRFYTPREHALIIVSAVRDYPPRKPR